MMIGSDTEVHVKASGVLITSGSVVPDPEMQKLIPVTFEPIFTAISPGGSIADTHYVAAVRVKMRIHGLGLHNLLNHVNGYITTAHNAILPAPTAQERFRDEERLLRNWKIPQSIATNIKQFMVFLDLTATELLDPAITGAALTTGVPSRVGPVRNLPSVTHRWTKLTPFVKIIDTVNELEQELYDTSGREIVHYRLHTKRGLFSSSLKNYVTANIKDFFTDVEFTLTDQRHFARSAENGNGQNY